MKPDLGEASTTQESTNPNPSLAPICGPESPNLPKKCTIPRYIVLREYSGKTA